MLPHTSTPLLTKLGAFNLRRRREVEKPHQLAVHRPHHPGRHLRVAGPRSIRGQACRLGLASARRDHGDIRGGVYHGQGEGDPLGRGLWGVGDEGDPLLLLAEHRVVGEEGCHVAVRAHSEEDEVELWAVVDLRHANDTGLDELPDDELVVLRGLLRGDRVVDRVHVAVDDRHLKMKHIPIKLTTKLKQ